MDLIFAHPWGALALLALPTLLLIHLLRQRPQSIRVTTLFLLEAAAPRQLKGRQIDRVSKKMQLLLRLLFALLATWFLVAPRWPQTDQAIDIAIVMDASASMSAYVDKVQADVMAQIEPLVRGRKVRLSLLSSGPGRALLAKGGQEALPNGLKAWRPNLGDHDATLAIEVAQGRVGPEGLVIWVTDHAVPSRPGVWSMSVGEPEANVALTGVEVSGDTWQATVHSYAQASQTRDFEVLAKEQVVSTGTLQMEPGQTRLLSGAFPKGIEQLEVRLSADALAIDDRLTIVRARTKKLRVYVSSDAQSLAAVQRLMGATPQVEPVQHPLKADLRIDWEAEPSAGDFPNRGPAKLWFVKDPKLEVRQPAIAVVVAPDLLTDDLPWQGLVFRRPSATKLPQQGLGLVWKGSVPLVYRMPGPHLVVRVDPRGSNLDRNPAFVLMLARFLEQVRAGLPREEVLNLEVGAGLSVPARSGAGPVLVKTDQGTKSYPEAAWGSLQAPELPGAFAVHQGNQRLLVGAARFADLRECDLRAAAPQSLPEDAVVARARTLSTPDPLRPFLGVLLIALALAGYGLGRARS